MNIQLWNGSAFPAILEPTNGTDLSAYLNSNRDQVDETLATTGAVLFRGFHVPTVGEFDAGIVAYGAENFTYKDSLSNAVRINLTPRVFTANEAPPTTSIFLHHEMAQTPIYPSKLFFYCHNYCHKAAERGGATPLCRSDILLNKLSEAEPELIQEFVEKGVSYSNTMPAHDDHNSGQGRSWRSTLSAKTKPDAETRLRTLGYSWAWGDDETLRMTSPKLDAVKILPDGSSVFFNQLIAAYRGWSDTRNEASKSISFGDGSPIDADKLGTAIQLADELSFDLNWHSGDVALVDNFRVMHGRRPYEGTRKVLVSLVN